MIDSHTEEIKSAIKGWLSFGRGKFATKRDRDTAAYVIKGFRHELQTGENWHAYRDRMKKEGVYLK